MADREKVAFDVNIAEYVLTQLEIELRRNLITGNIDVIDLNNILKNPPDPVLALQDYLIVNYRDTYKYVQRESVAGIIRLFADNHGCNPILDKVESIAPKIKNHDYISEIADDILHLDPADHLSRLYLKKFMMQAIAMQYNNDKERPYGADGILTLINAQGDGKSLFTQRMGQGYSRNLRIGQYIDEADFYSKCNGVFVGELPELEQSLRPSTKDFIKDFITASHDAYRPKYGASTVDRLRTSTYIATCNSQTFLQDRTGNRRFWCIKCEKPFNIKRLSNFDDDIFLKAYAQAYKELKKNGMQSFRLSKEERELTELRNVNFMAVNPDLSNIILSILDLVDVDHFTINDLKGKSSELASMSTVIIGRELSRMREVESKRTKGERFYRLIGKGKKDAGK